MRGFIVKNDSKQRRANAKYPGASSNSNSPPLLLSYLSMRGSWATDRRRTSNRDIFVPRISRCRSQGKKGTCQSSIALTLIK